LVFNSVPPPRVCSPRASPLERVVRDYGIALIGGAEKAANPAFKDASSVRSAIIHAARIDLAGCEMRGVFGSTLVRAIFEDAKTVLGKSSPR